MQEEIDKQIKIFDTRSNVRKRIYQYQHGDRKVSIGVILVGYCPDTLLNFMALFQIAQRDFPKIKMENVNCGKVTKSDTIKGYTLILFEIHSKFTIPDKWDVCDYPLNFNY